MAATPEQQALIALQAEMQQTRAQLATVSGRFDHLSAAHTALQAAHDLLRADASRVLGERGDQIHELERSIANLLKKQHCDLLDLKAMKPTTFKGERNEKWRPWARRTKAYCNAKHAGFRAALEWAEKQTEEITDFSTCPWNRASGMDSALYEFLCQALGGHAVLIADTPGMEERGFEVWRRAHKLYSPAGAQYETDMLQQLMSQAPAKDMPALADAVAKFEYDWRKYEQETDEKLTEKFKAAALLKMFPKNAQTDELKRLFQQGKVGFADMVGQVISYNQFVRSESAYRRGDSDAMMLDALDKAFLPTEGTEMTVEELGVFYLGFEEAFAAEGASTTNPDSLDRPLAALYRKGFSKGKGKGGKGKGQGGQQTGQKAWPGKAAGGKGEKGQERKRKAPEDMRLVSQKGP